MSQPEYEYRPTTVVFELLSSLLASENAPQHTEACRPRNALRHRMAVRSKRQVSDVTPMDRMQHCRQALERLDTAGWKRSYHQRLFHDDFLVSLFMLRPQRGF